jgi:hypothetical protein
MGRVLWDTCGDAMFGSIADSQAGGERRGWVCVVLRLESDVGEANCGEVDRGW